MSTSPACLEGPNKWEKEIKAHIAGLKIQCKIDEVAESFWIDCPYPSWSQTETYRIAPSAPSAKLELPWDFISKEFNFAAMDESGDIWLYSDEPQLTSHAATPEIEDRWMPKSERSSVIELDDCDWLDLKLDNVHWKFSLSERPMDSD